MLELSSSALVCSPATPLPVYNVPPQPERPLPPSAGMPEPSDGSARRKPVHGGAYVPQQYVPQEYVPQQYVPREYVPQEYELQQHVPQEPGAARAGGCGREAKVPALQKSMSMVAPDVANRIRDKVSNGLVIASDNNGRACSWMSPIATRAHNTLVLPPFKDFSPAISSYLYWRLLDVWRLERLQACGAINSLPGSESVAVDRRSEIIAVTASPRCRHNHGGGGGPDRARALYSALLPMNVMGDGNCCLHACSVALWGIQDRRHSMRDALSTLMRQQRARFYKRWRQQEAEWDREDGMAMGLPDGMQT